MAEEQRRKHIDHIRQYVEQEVAWGRENLKGQELDNFLNHTVDYYLREVEKLLGAKPTGS